MERVAAGRSSPDSLAFEPAERPDNRADYCLKHGTKNFSVIQSEARLIFLPAKVRAEIANHRFAFVECPQRFIRPAVHVEIFSGESS